MLEKFLSILQKSLNKITPSALEYSNKKNMILKDLISRSINAGLRQTSRIFLQFDFETMCAKELNEYCWVERLDPVSMSQVFTNAFTNKSDFKVKYSESENGLLICLTNYGGHERLEHKSIDMVVRARLCFGLFYDLIRQDKREYIGKNVNIIIPAPVQKKESSTDVLSKSPESTLDIIQPIIEPVVDNSTIYDTFDKVIQIKEDLSIINTSDGSRIEVCNISSMCIGDSTSIKYFWKDDILSFSNSRATYSSSGVIFNIQLDSKGLRLDLSFDGLMVSFGNDVVIQKRWGIVDQNSLSSNVFMLDERDTICSRLSFKNVF